MSAAQTTETYDPTYHRRHAKRNEGRVAQVVAHSVPGPRYLDIGCNAGYFSQALLDNGIAQRVDAIEVTPDPVSPKLLEDSRFHLFAGDATTFPFEHRYTGVVFGAVHHHIFGIQGHLAAFRFWRELVDHTDEVIFFETGHVLEGSRWFWQRSLREYYLGDEDHIGALIQAIGPRLAKLDVVGRYPIHGTDRWFIRIGLRPRPTSLLTPPTGEPVTVRERFQRTLGSRAQRLIPLGSETSRDRVYDGVVFSDGVVAETGERVFCKKCQYDGNRDLREYNIAAQVDHPAAVRPIALRDDVGVVYPYVTAHPLQAEENLSRRDRESLCEALIDFYEYASEKDIDIGDLDLDPAQRARTRKLIELVDLNTGNILVEMTSAGPTLRVVDFEYFGNHNAARNLQNMAKLLVRLRHRSRRTLRLLARAAVEVPADHLRASLQPIESRIYDRRVSLARYGVMRVREAIDAVAQRLPGYQE